MIHGQILTMDRESVLFNNSISKTKISMMINNISEREKRRVKQKRGVRTTRMRIV